MKNSIVISVVLISCAFSAMAHDTLKIKALEKRVAALEAKMAKLDSATAPVVKQANADQVCEDQKNKARERMRKDLKVYSKDELRAIESLYQVANKNWKTDKAKGKASLLKMVSKYDKANRTGCALLYIGQMTQGEERESYLKQAIEGYSDCFYGDGVQVGAYARYYLAYYYKDAGDKKKAKALFDEIRKDYPNAITHSGKSLSIGMAKE